jgi:hypothetical protein
MYSMPVMLRQCWAPSVLIATRELELVNRLEHNLALLTNFYVQSTNSNWRAEMMQRIFA